MLIVQVFAHVHPDAVDAFLTATLDNARHSVLEPGVVRFDVIQPVSYTHLTLPTTERV